MKATNYALLLIKSFEQLRLNSYLCPAGVWTIGYGHTAGVNRGMLITEKTADAFLQQDIRNAEHCINQMGADLTQEQF
jgi:lysozyme